MDMDGYIVLFGIIYFIMGVWCHGWMEEYHGCDYILIGLLWPIVWPIAICEYFLTKPKR